MWQQQSTGTTRVQDCQRHDDGSRPGRHLVDVQSEPGWENRQFWRYGRDKTPFQGPHHREVKARERIGALETAEKVYPTPRIDQMRRIRGIASELQRDIRLDRRVQLRGASLVNVPSAVGQLVCADVIGKLPDPRRASEDVQVQDVIGLEGRVGFQLTAPVAFVGSAIQEPRDAALDGT